MIYLEALLPVILIVGLGQFLAARQLPGPDGWRAIERLCYVLLFPALIIRILADAPFEDAPWRIALALAGSQVLMVGVGLLAHAWPGMTRPAIGSIIQSNVRWNTFIALSLAGGLFGAQGLALTAIAAAVMIPLANILSVLALTHHAEITDIPKRNPFLELTRNPLVIACGIGIALNLSGLNLPDTGQRALDILADSALALGLLAAGAGVDLSALKRAGLRTFVFSLMRLLIMPLIAVALGLVLGADRVTLSIIAIAAGVPTATNGYILARQLGGDAPLMANLIAVQTVLAILTLPLVLALVAMVGGN